MKKRKLNIKGLIALTIWISALGLLVYDFVMLMKGATYTWYGLCTLGAMLLAGCMAEDYIHERINK